MYVGIFTSFFPASLILIFYRFLAFFIGQYHLDTPSMIIFTICFGGSAFIMVSELLLCTMLSQKLLDEIKLLVDMLQEIPIKVRIIISLVPKRLFNFPQLIFRTIILASSKAKNTQQCTLEICWLKNWKFLKD